jgi:hypothetical protein
MILMDGVPVAGDVYHRNKFSFAVRLKRGVRQVAIRLRAKMEATFRCQFTLPPKEPFEVRAVIVLLFLFLSYTVIS